MNSDTQAGRAPEEDELRARNALLLEQQAASIQALNSRNAELQNFYHTVTHELKTPLTSAREFASILLDGLAGPLTDTQRHYVQLIRESCDQLQFCVADLAEATQLETGKLGIHPVEVPVAALVAGVTSALEPSQPPKKPTAGDARGPHDRTATRVSPRSSDAPPCPSRGAAG